MGYRGVKGPAQPPTVSDRPGSEDCVVSEQWFSARGDLDPWETSDNFWRHVLLSQSGVRGLLLASSRERPGMLLNILQATGSASPPSNKELSSLRNYPV